MTSKEALNDIKKRNNALKEEGHFHIGTKVMGVIEDLVSRDTPKKVIKTPHERMLELGFTIDDETNYFIAYVFNGLEIIIYKKEKTYQTYSYRDNYNPINLQLAEVLVDYLKELENE